MEETKNKAITSDRVDTLIKRIQKVYLFIMCIGVIDFIYNALSGPETLSFEERLQGVLTIFICFSIYIGLKFRKKWVIPLILISSAFLGLSTFLSVFQPASDIVGLISKVVGIILVLFYAWQIRFFSRKEVRDFLGTKETIVF